MELLSGIVSEIRWLDDMLSASLIVKVEKK